jgi:CRP/FNR family transcriptional regulator, cyclic AMP receptor protein
MWTSIDINWIDMAGYAASALVFLTFYMKTMIPLRVIGILSNIVFMAYGFAGGVYPVFILHAILLPLNCIRLIQMQALIRKVRDAAQSDLSVDWLMPFMHRRHVAKGQTLFRRGDRANELYFILSGSIRLVDVAVSLGPGDLLGEIGIFAPASERMDTAMCETDVEVGVVGNDKVLQLYHQNPKLGLYLIRIVSQRLLENYATLRDASGTPTTSLASDASTSR